MYLFISVSHRLQSNCFYSVSHRLQNNSLYTKQVSLIMNSANSDFVNCPLVPHHRLLRHRLPFHLVKCRLRLQQAAESLVEEWAATTSMQPSVGSSSDQPQDEEVLESPQSPDETPASEGAAAAKEQQEEDNWDADDYPSYTPPERVLFQKPPPFLSKNERKRWRFEQRLKFPQ